MPPAGRDPWQRWAALGWGAALAIVCARVVLAPHSHNVLPIYLAAGNAWLEGDALYGRVLAGLDVFRYSPLIAALFAPLAGLPESLANVLWRLGSAGLFLAALFWWRRTVLPTPLATCQGQLSLLVLPLALASLNNGQSNLVVAALILAAFAGAAQERWNVSAGCTALATMLKLYPVVAGVLLVALYPRRLGLRTAAGLVLAGLVPFLLQSPGYVTGQYVGWLAYLRADDRQLLPLDLWLRDIRLLFRAWGLPLSTAAFLVLQVVLGLAVAGLCLSARRQGWPPRRLLTLATALACGWMIVAGPAVESCTYVLLAPSLAAALLNPNQTSSPAGHWFLLGCYGLLLLAGGAGWFPWGRAVSNLGPQPLAALGFFGHAVAGVRAAVGRPRLGSAGQAA